MTPPRECLTPRLRTDSPRLDSISEAPKCPVRGPELLLRAEAKGSANEFASRPNRTGQRSSAARRQTRKLFRPLPPLLVPRVALGQKRRSCHRQFRSTRLPRQSGIPRGSSFPHLRGEGMNSALKLRSAPAAGPWIVWIERESRARLASDAQITFVVLRQVRDGVGISVLPHLFPVPVGEQAYFPKISAGGQSVEFELLQILACRGLFAPQPGEPHVKRFERAH